MKKINKSSPPNPLTDFAAQVPNASWDDFRAQNAGKDYSAITQTIFSDQGQLCAFCETRIESGRQNIDLQCVEHFHSKSDTNNVGKNWALDWGNVIGVCRGGSGRDNKHIDGTTIFPTPANLSCDQYKGHLITRNKLPVACEGQLLNPLLLPASPCLFKLNRQTGELQPNSYTCRQITIEGNTFRSAEELVENTITVLNLNCDRLNKKRLSLFHSYEKQKKRARMNNDKLFFKKQAELWFRVRWPEFFTTKRFLLGVHAERYLEGIGYDG